MEKTINCAECKKSYTYDETPGYPRKYCLVCSALKKQAYEAEPKITTEIPTDAISGERLEVRQSCLKAAVRHFKDCTNEDRHILDIANNFEDWVWR